MPIQPQQQRNLIVVLTLLLFCWLILSWFMAASIMESRAQILIQHKTATLQVQVDNIAHSIERNLRYLHGVPATVAINDKVIKALSRPDTTPAHPALSIDQQKKAWSEDPSLQQLNKYLGLVSSSLGVDVLWITNATGDCIASSNAATPSSFVATNYADREYFREAREGKPGHQYAVGRKTNIPGFFFSVPITIAGRFAGVAVAKIDLTALSHWVDQADVFIVDKYGVIISARDKKLEVSSLPGATVASLSEEERLARYKRKDFPPLIITPWEKEHFPTVYRINGEQKPLLMNKRALPEDEIEVHLISRLTALDNYEADRLNIVVLSSLAGIAILLFIGSRIIINRIRRRAEFQKAESIALQLEIAKRIESEKQLADSHNLLKTIINTSPMRIFWKDRDSRYMGCNPAFARDAGFEDPAELIGKDDYQLSWQAQAELYRADDRQVIASGKPKVSFDEPQTTPEGWQIWLRTSKVPLRNDSLEIIGILGIYEDITDRKQAEEERLEMERQLLHAQKVESLGVLSGGIAHDFNNLLQALLGNLDLALMKLPAVTVARDYINQAIIAGDKAAKLTNMMLAYTGKGIFIIHELNLTELVEENVGLLAAAISKSITFKLELDHNLPNIMADSGQLQQVVMNLITNACEAIGDNSGTITLSTGVQDFDQASLNASRLETKLTAGRYVWMQVSDNGCGMDEEIQQKIFDPFFTTKFTGRGLGMSAVQGILKAHKGAFLVDSRQEVGTTIRVLFPVAEKQASQTASSSSAPVAVNSKKDHQAGTILIVDDDEMIREITVAMLKSFGFDTLTASCGLQALEIYLLQKERICLVILDQSMPNMDGLTAFTELKTINPDIKVILASGYSEVEIAARYDGLGLSGFIQKPFNMSQLSVEIHRVIKEV